MTAAERALLELVVCDRSIAEHSKRLTEARNAVMVERLASLSPAVKERWQAAYRAQSKARRALRSATESCLIPEGWSLDPWRAEVDAALDTEDES